jgi:preprotein translocase subunit SecA
MLTGAIENAQKKVEGNNFSARKRLLDYDRVMNEQRELIYAQRREVLTGAELKDKILKMVKNVITRVVDRAVSDPDDPTVWDMTELNEKILHIFDLPAYTLTDEDMQTIDKETLIERIYNDAAEKYNSRENEYGSDMFRELERVITLRVVDTKWMDHIDNMDQMRQGIALRSYGQRDPLIEYQFISYDMFDELNQNIQNDIVTGMFHVRIVTPEAPQREQVAQPTSTNMDDSASSGPKVRKEPKIGRNDPCPCGSGLKYKNCCGKNE